MGKTQNSIFTQTCYVHSKENLASANGHFLRKIGLVTLNFSLCPPCLPMPAVLGLSWWGAACARSQDKPLGWTSQGLSSSASDPQNIPVFSG